ncbi:hypothetical protein BS47DRAFT_1402844 [Hydnum rufescens UP504]|uniref:Uncharacterized protein n=1 Tax=Hydnum rufescens UP504 TaxID=1448309 RepID=A0A9P6AC19_9AGAM|nr:hypothetical protein BS47DRAFT_1402844 [Hydnum rufescens UP504]
MVPSASAISLASMISSASTVPSTSRVPSTPANAPFKSRTTMGANFITRFAQAALDQDVDWNQDVDSGSEFLTPSDSEDSNNEHFDDVFGKEDENGNALHLDAFSNIAMITFLINQDFQDGYATTQNCTITRSPEITQALDPFKANILKTLHNAVRTANTLKTTNSGEIEPKQLVEEKKHKALMNQDTARAALSAFMKPILEPHGISILNSRDGAKWAFPMKQLGLKLCTKELTLVGWPDDLLLVAKDPDDVDQYPLIKNNKGETLLHICDIQPWLPKKSGTLIHPQCHIRRGNSKHDDPSPTPIHTSRTILHPIGALVHTLTLTPALIPALAPDIILILNLLFNLSLNLKVIQGNSHNHDQEVPWWHTMSDL